MALPRGGAACLLLRPVHHVQSLHVRTVVAASRAAWLNVPHLLRGQLPDQLHRKVIVLCLSRAGPEEGGCARLQWGQACILWRPSLKNRDADSQRIQFEFAEFAANSFAARIRCEFGLKILVLRILGEFALRIRRRRPNDHVCAVFSPDETVTLNCAMQ